MVLSISETRKRSGGRPKVNSTPLLVRLPPDDLELLDLWIAANVPDASRPEAIRRILRLVAMRVPQGAETISAQRYAELLRANAEAEGISLPDGTE